VYAVWLIAQATLRRAPRPLLDDPKNLGGWVDIAHTASVLLFLLALPILVASVAAVLWRGALRRTPWKNALLWLALLQLSWITAGLIARLDPGHVVAWYLD
jgi:hypothetical protein